MARLELLTLVGLDDQLSSLGPSQDLDVMLALPIEECPGSRIAHGSRGEIYIFVPTRDELPSQNIILRYMEAKSNVAFRVRAPNEEVCHFKGVYIKGLTDSRATRLAFLTIMRDALEEFVRLPAQKDIVTWFTGLAMLFSCLEEEGRRNIQGLWTELAIILFLENTSAAVQQWHEDPHERFDFFSGKVAIEIKSSQNHERIHHFSLRQVHPPFDLLVFLISIVLKADSRGTSILELTDSIKDKLKDSKSYADFLAKVFRCGGRQLLESENYRFNLNDAQKSLRIIKMEDVPKIQRDVPPGVIDVKLTVRCENLPYSNSLSELGRRMESGSKEIF